MRKEKSAINAIASLITYTLTIIIGFAAQSIFIKTLGKECLGLNGLFSNIISVLAIAELGFGSAIIYNLYKPLKENNKEEIKSLINYYKIIYRIICIVIFILGLCVLPFLNIIVGKITISINIHLIFILYLFDTVCSYMLTYKRSILYADQKTYVINFVHIGYIVFMNMLQIIELIKFKNFVFYLIIKIIFRILENVVITIVANKQYPYLKEKNIKRIDKKIKNDIIKKVKGLFFHQIGSAIVLGTDNIIISMTRSLGVITVGLYSNYNMVISTVLSLFSQMFSSATASVGNLLIEDDKSKTYLIFKDMLLLNSWIFAFASAGIICMIEPFIKLWIGEGYLLSKTVLITLVINFYISGMRNTYGTFKNAAGIFYEDRFVPLVESSLNIIFSLLFVKYFGLAGVFMGTIVSSFALYFYSYPKYVYGLVLNKSHFYYAKDLLKYIIITVISIVPAYLLTEFINVSNQFLQFIINAVVVILVPNIIYYLFFKNTDEYKYCKNLLLCFFMKYLKHNKSI